MGQHYVPEVYLKEFSHKQGMFYVFNKVDALKYPKYKIESKAYRSYCQEKDFYTIDTDSLNILGITENIDPYVVENKVNKSFEDDYGKYFKLITSEGFLAPTKAEIFIKMLVHFKLRNKSWRQSYNTERIISILQKEVDNLTERAINNELHFENISVDVKIQTIEKVFNQYSETKDLDKQFQLLGLLKRSKYDTDLTIHFIDLLMKSKWTLMVSDGSSRFITTDNPGFSIDRMGKLHNTKFIEDAKFYFPISPYYCIIIDTGCNDIEFIFNPSKKTIIHQVANFALVSIVNHNSAKLANKYLFSDNPTILEYFKLNP